VSPWLFILCVLCSFCVLAACRRAPPTLPPLIAQLSGAFETAGLSAPVRIVRDTWGVPHIYALNQDDLFFAQGFVQAQDRLFQMDLWRRSVQGRLSEVLGANFVERDAMTRRVQYRGDPEAEWASYGPDAKTIAAAFVGGINAWVALARARPPEEFVLAGWKPELWAPGDLLNRTDAFVASGDAIDEASRRRLSGVVVDAIRRVGTPPFFVGLAAPVQISPKAEPAGATTPEPARTLAHPSPRYLVHLKAPRWNVIGATAPWLPGVAVGHNERIAWNPSPFDADTQDVYAERPGPSPRDVVKEPIVVKGRSTPFVFDIERTPHGVVVASDRAHDLAFTVRWSGMESGAAAELGALAIDRARSWMEFREAAARWKMPARKFLYSDVDQNTGFQVAALVPIRRASEWIGWRTVDDLPHAFNVAARTTAVSGPQNESAVFAHPLGITDAARRRFNVGPLTPRGRAAAPFSATFDAADWDRSSAINAPGQSGSPESPHFADLAKIWAAGESFPLAFSDRAVQVNAETTLTLIPLK
jgi:penicillin amidase